MKINKSSTPQAIFNHKNTWKGTNLVQIDCDSYHWSKDYCKQHFDKSDWNIKKHTRQDDSHTLSFAYGNDKDLFIEAYRKHNPNFNINLF